VFVTNHVLLGAIVGAAAPQHPFATFGLGVVSHYVLDAVPHWGVDADSGKFLRYAVVDGLIGLAAMGYLAGVAPRDERCSVVLAMFGAAAPDLDKPSRLVFGRSPFPSSIDRFHGRLQRESSRGLWREALVGLVLTTCVGMSRHRGSQPAGNPSPSRPALPRGRGADRTRFNHDWLLLSAFAQR